jgi:ankyrin repeat protein
LQEAAAEADTEDIKELLEQGADLEERNSRGDTALLWAAATGSFENVVLLIRAGANVDAQNGYGNGAIMAATRLCGTWCPDPELAPDSDPVAVVQVLLAAGANPDPVAVAFMEPIGKSSNCLEAYTYTPLSQLRPRLSAFPNGQGMALLTTLLAAGADPNWRDLDGDTPLVGTPVIVPFPFFQTYGPKTNWPSSNKQGSGLSFPWPLALGSMNRLWLAGGVPPDPRIGEVVWLLLQYGADPNATNLRKWTALHSAAWQDHREAYQILLAAGADIHALAEGDTTVLMAASYASGSSWGKFEEVVADLLAAGLSANAEDRRGATALMYGVEGGNLKIIETLLKGGSGEKADPSRAADPNHQDHDGKTALIWLFDPPSFNLERMREPSAIARLLLEHGADPYLQDKYGKSALDYGGYGLERIVEELNP